MFLLQLLACGLLPPAPQVEGPDAAQLAREGAELLNRGDLPGARNRFERSLAIPAVTEAQRRARIGVRSRLIDVVVQGAQPADALPLARTGIEERLALRSPDDGFDVADGVVLLGQVQAAVGRPIELPDLPLDADPLYQAVRERSGREGSAYLVPVLTVLVDRMPDERLHGARAGLAWQAGRTSDALASTHWLRTHGSAKARLEAGLLLPRIHEDRGARAAAEAAYREVCSELPEPDSLRCHREFGLFAAEDPDRADLARTELQLAATATDPEVRGRALAALGVLEVHDGSPIRARPLLKDAVAALPPGHPDGLFARDHLATLGTGSCVCTDPSGSLESTLLAHADAELPGLVQDVTLAPSRTVRAPSSSPCPGRRPTPRTRC